MWGLKRALEQVILHKTYLKKTTEGSVVVTKKH